MKGRGAESSGSGWMTARWPAAWQPRAARTSPNVTTRRTAAPPARGRAADAAFLATWRVGRVGAIHARAGDQAAVLDVRVPQPPPRLLLGDAQHGVVHAARLFVA